jgi:hypothetical protein
MDFGARKFEIRKYVLSQSEETGYSSRVLGLLLHLFAPFELFRG